MELPKQSPNFDVLDIEAMLPFGIVETLDYEDLDAELDAIQEIIRDEPSLTEQGLEQSNRNQENSVRWHEEILNKCPDPRAQKESLPGVEQQQIVDKAAEPPRYLPSSLVPFDEQKPNQEQVSVAECIPTLGLAVSLINSKLWQRFNEHVNEMNVRKVGRNMFPYIHVGIRGLDPKKVYSIYLDFPLQSGDVWKYKDDEWSVSRREDEHLLRTCGSRVEHPFSPKPGYFWMNLEKGIEFKKVKFTNDASMASKSSHVCLKTFHKYQPRLNVVEVDGTTGQRNWNTLITYPFPETVFIAVTQYRNPKINELKIFHNPMAKAHQTDMMKQTVGFDQEPSCLTHPLSVARSPPDTSFLDFSDMDLPQYEPKAKRPRLFHDENYCPDFSVLTD